MKINSTDMQEHFPYNNNFLISLDTCLSSIVGIGDAMKIGELISLHLLLERFKYPPVFNKDRKYFLWLIYIHFLQITLDT